MGVRTYTLSHDDTPLSHSPAVVGSVRRGRRLVIGHGHQCVHAMDESLSASQWHSGVFATRCLPSVHGAFAALPSIIGMYRHLPRSFFHPSMSNDTKNAGLAYLLSVVIVVAVAALPTVVL